MRRREMPTWMLITVLTLIAWPAASLPSGLLLGRALARRQP
jgi:hypothetical protein